MGVIGIGGLVPNVLAAGAGVRERSRPAVAAGCRPGAGGGPAALGSAALAPALDFKEVNAGDPGAGGAPDPEGSRLPRTPDPEGSRLSPAVGAARSWTDVLPGEPRGAGSLGSVFGFGTHFG